jgi:hypothetical protein
VRLNKADVDLRAERSVNGTTLSDIMNAALLFIRQLAVELQAPVNAVDVPLLGFTLSAINCMDPEIAKMDYYFL